MVSGRPDVNTGINNSGLARIKRILSGGAPFLGGERYLQFGTEYHYRCLERKVGKWLPSNSLEKDAMVGMQQSLLSCKLFTSNYPGSIREKRVIHPKAFGIHRMHGTIDLKKIKGKQRIGIDLKTTSATTEAEFIKKAFELGYPRQGCVYEELEALTEFYFIGVSKNFEVEDDGITPVLVKGKKVYPHWVMDLNNYSNEKIAATEEACFLLEFFHEFGVPIKSGIKNETLESYLLSGSDSESQKRRKG